MSSHELEVELEAQLEQTEAKNKELRSANYRLQMDLQSLRVGTISPWMVHFSSSHVRLPCYVVSKMQVFYVLFWDGLLTNDPPY